MGSGLMAALLSMSGVMTFGRGVGTASPPGWPNAGRRRVMRNKEGLPRGYPGAKLARKAMRKQITMRHITYQG
jgi:hypothetical protein